LRKNLSPTYSSKSGRFLKPLLLSTLSTGQLTCRQTTSYALVTIQDVVEIIKLSTWTYATNCGLKIRGEKGYFALNRLRFVRRRRCWRPWRWPRVCFPRDAPPTSNPPPPRVVSEWEKKG